MEANVTLSKNDRIGYCGFNYSHEKNVCKDIGKLVNRVEDIEGVSSAELFNMSNEFIVSLFGFKINEGLRRVMIKGRFNPADVYSVLTNQGYSIVDSEVRH